MTYDPPSGWMYGFPKEYDPLPNETLKETLIRDGYPASEINDCILNHCRFIGSQEELENLKV